MAARLLFDVQTHIGTKVQLAAFWGWSPIDYHTMNDDSSQVECYCYRIAQAQSQHKNNR